MRGGACGARIDRIFQNGLGGGPCGADRIYEVFAGLNRILDNVQRMRLMTNQPMTSELVYLNSAMVSQRTCMLSGWALGRMPWPRLRM